MRRRDDQAPEETRGVAADARPAVRFIEPDGTPSPGVEQPDLLRYSPVELHRLMVLARRIDEEGKNLQRQGVVGGNTQIRGQEAAQIGSAAALEDEDWVFPSYRELGVGIVRGLDPVDLFQMARRTRHGGAWDVRQHRFAPYCIPVATQLLHAVGFAMSAARAGEKIAAVAYFGDGATSEGDFHEACNLAGVFRAPVVFFCQNNQYAISLPVGRQTASDTLAVKAVGYGFPGVRVDGNDVVAVHEVTREALDRARSGGGPTLIEAVTFRLGGHASSDDPTRYRSEEEVSRWEALDPIRRCRRYVSLTGRLSDEVVARHEAAAEEAAMDLRTRLTDVPVPSTEDMFDFVYDVPLPDIAQQRHRALEREMRKETSR